MLTLSPLQEGIGFLLVGCWLGYVGYRIEYHRAPFWLYLALIGKVFAAWGFGWLYAHYYCHGDTLKAYLTARQLTYYLWEAPQDGVALLLRELSPRWDNRGWEIFFRDVHLYGYDYEWSEPANYHFYRMLVPLYILSGGSYYGLQGLMGILGGLLSFAAYRRWEGLAPLPTKLWIVWFFMPSALLWTSGALRDTLAFPLTLYATAWVASVRRLHDMWGAGALLVLALLRPEGAALAVGTGLLYRHGRVWTVAVAALAAICLLGMYIGPRAYLYRAEALDPALHPEVGEASTFSIAFSPDFPGSLIGWLRALPYGLVGPFPWQIHKPLVLLYGIEVWILTAAGVYHALRARWTVRTLVLLAAGIFVVGVVAMAMPYWGTLARQRLYGLYLIALGIAASLQPAFQNRQHSLREP